MTDEDLTTLTDQDRTTRDSTRVWPAPGSVPGMTTLWHLAEPAHWAQARERGSYERSTRGASLASVGFVHCCYPEQLPGVVARFYADAAATGDYVVLELDGELLERAGSPVRDEPGNPDDPASPLFPHVYGPIPVPAVTGTRAASVRDGILTVAQRPAG